MPACLLTRVVHHHGMRVPPQGDFIRAFVEAFLTSCPPSREAFCGVKLDHCHIKSLSAPQSPLSSHRTKHADESSVQEPVLRTSCSRVAYQTIDSAALRVSIDTDLRFTKVSVTPSVPGSRPKLKCKKLVLDNPEWCGVDTNLYGGDWCRYYSRICNLCMPGSQQREIV